MFLSLFIFSFLCIHSIAVELTPCDVNHSKQCSAVKPFRYLLYDVNPPEGFNLRRDVYLRMAILTHLLQKVGNWVLVLPPWPNLYHWLSNIDQQRLAWSAFFDVRSLQKFVPVIEFMDFLDLKSSGVIDHVYILQNFPEMFKTLDFVEKSEIRHCLEPPSYFQHEPKGRYQGQFWGFPEITALGVSCMSFHGKASLLIPQLQSTNYSSIMLDHAEVILHDGYGDSTYWKARRSMRFADHLTKYATYFREKFLNSTDKADRTQRPEQWTFEKEQRNAKGGPYLCIHLRRRDFVRVRKTEIPSLKKAAKHVNKILHELNLKTVFVATDAPFHEKEMLSDELMKYKIKMVTFHPTGDELLAFRDGGIAIIEQIICSYARKFYGSHESTYSFRIQEEREILGFPPASTFNRLCGDDNKNCEQPSKWLIRY